MSRVTLWWMLLQPSTRTGSCVRDTFRSHSLCPRCLLRLLHCRIDLGHLVQMRCPWVGLDLSQAASVAGRADPWGGRRSSFRSTLPGGQQICFAFNNEGCSVTNCPRAHLCLRCHGPHRVADCNAAKAGKGSKGKSAAVPPATEQGASAAAGGPAAAKGSFQLSASSNTDGWGALADCSSDYGIVGGEISEEKEEDFTFKGVCMENVDITDNKLVDSDSSSDSGLEQEQGSGWRGNGPPLGCKYRGRWRPINDGGGDCSPFRWPTWKRRLPDNKASGVIRLLTESFLQWTAGVDINKL
eukprot:4902256-Amphidinium_carterae.1